MLCCFGFWCFYFSISYQGVPHFSKFVCLVLDISENLITHLTTTIRYSLNKYCGNLGNQYVYPVQVNSLLYNYYENTYLIKHIRPMLIPTSTISNATRTPNTIYDTLLYSLYSSINIDG